MVFLCVLYKPNRVKLVFHIYVRSRTGNMRMYFETSYFDNFVTRNGRVAQPKIVRTSIRLYMTVFNLLRANIYVLAEFFL